MHIQCAFSLWLKTIYQSISASYPLNIKDSEVNVVGEKLILVSDCHILFSTDSSSFLPLESPISLFPWHKIWSSHLQTGWWKYFCYCVVIPDWKSNVVSPLCLCSMPKTDGNKSMYDLILWFTLTSCNLLFLPLIRRF